MWAFFPLNHPPELTGQKFNSFSTSAEKCSTGLAEWNNITESVEALVLANHSEINHPSKFDQHLDLNGPSRLLELMQISLFKWASFRTYSSCASRPLRSWTATTDLTWDMISTEERQYKLSSQIKPLSQSSRLSNWKSPPFFILYALTCCWTAVELLKELSLNFGNCQVWLKM